VYFNTCEPETFECITEGFDEYLMELVTEDCVEDFKDYEFWSMMQHEQYWHAEENQDLKPFYDFWMDFHKDGPPEPEECKDEFMEFSCAEFSFSEDDPCFVSFSYDTCDFESFSCHLEYTDGTESEDCKMYFESIYYWTILGAEDFWNSDDERIQDIFDYWMEYHMAPRDYCYFECFERPCENFEENCHYEICYDCQDELAHCQYVTDEGAEDCMSWYDATGDGEDCEDVCEDFDCSIYTEDAMCTMTECYNTCTYLEDCTATWENMPGSATTASCEEFFNWYEEQNGDGGDDCTGDEDWICEEFDDCIDDIVEFIDGVTYCSHQYCYQECTNADGCQIEWTVDGEDYSMDCQSFADIYFPDGPDDDDCEEVHDVMDCKALAEDAGMPLELCEVHEVYDECTDEEWCFVKFKNPMTGEIEEADCAMFEDYLPDDDGKGGDDDECDYECTEAFPCPENDFAAECQMIECYSTCDHQGECYAEWTDHEGMTHDKTCQDFYNMMGCDEMDQQQEDECDYMQCDSEMGGECWIEYCNKEQMCKPATCTKWEFNHMAQYWTAEDCSDHHDDEDMEWIGELFDNLHHYEESLNFLEENYCPEGNCVDEVADALIDALGLPRPIEDNADLINEFLADDTAVEAASLIVADTQEVLDSMDWDVSLDFLHSALSAEDHTQVQDMIWDALFNEWNYEEEESYDEEPFDEMNDDDMADEEDTTEETNDEMDDYFDVPDMETTEEDAEIETRESANANAWHHKRGQRNGF